jgi:hypothetical protein
MVEQRELGFVGLVSIGHHRAQLGCYLQHTQAGRQADKERVRSVAHACFCLSPLSVSLPLSHLFIGAGSLLLLWLLLWLLLVGERRL